jgi:hypothetical protein
MYFSGGKDYKVLVVIELVVVGRLVRPCRSVRRIFIGSTAHGIEVVVMGTMVVVISVEHKARSLRGGRDQRGWL